MMWLGSRRDFLANAGLAVAGSASGFTAAHAFTKERETNNVEILYPRNRVPLSFIIDDSTCLVNMGYYCTPQFAAAYPNREIYKRPWQTWKREIPDSFVRKFGEWCADQGVKGKYSIVPYPACVGWLDRELPGWSRKQLTDSLKLVRELMLPNWDIHPEMITHTRVIDLKTGRPYAEISPATIENSFPQQKKSVDELAAYIAYALRILKNCELPCEGVTTPGGFGNKVKSELSMAVQQAVRDVFSVDVPHYFKYVHTGSQSTEPILEHLSGRSSANPNFTLNVPAGTGDWFGGWQGVNPSQGKKYANDDASAGRMVELIQKRQPAIMLCHWPGLYCNGTQEGFHDFQRVVKALAKKYGEITLWMKLSEIARYWAAKELTGIKPMANGFKFQAPVATPLFTIRLTANGSITPRIKIDNKLNALKPVKHMRELTANTFLREGQKLTLCFALPKGSSHVVFQ